MLPYSARRNTSSRILVTLAAIAFTAVTVWWLLTQTGPVSQPTPVAGATATPAAAGVVNVYMFSSDTKEDWLNAVAADFNARQVRISTGQAVVVHIEPGDSGDSKDDIVAGTLTPTVWSPGDQSWVKALNYEWGLRHNGEAIIANDCQPTVYAPVGFAMFRPMAERMGWPDTPIGWRDITELMDDPDGWGRYGRPDWKPFKFGHTDPRSSNSGLLLLTALAYSVWDIRQGLTLEMVNSDEYTEALSLVEAHTYHYGDKSRDNVQRMMQLGEKFLHATNTSEAETLRANQGTYGPVVNALAFIFPSDGTFWAEHPFCILDGAWVTPEQGEAAHLFEAYLHERPQQELAVSNYLRPTDDNVLVGEPFSLANGTDPNESTVTAPNLDGPSPPVLIAVQDKFVQSRRKSIVFLLIDTSSSMTPSKMAPAAEAAAQLVKAMEIYDEVYVYRFGGSVLPLSPSGRVGDVSEELASTVETLIADGQTYLRDAICEAAAQVKAMQADDTKEAAQPLYAIVVLSDGDDTASTNTSNDVLNVCLAAKEEVVGVRVYTVAYGEDGEDSDPAFLQSLAQHTHGISYSANPGDVHEILLEHVLYQ